MMQQGDSAGNRPLSLGRTGSGSGSGSGIISSTGGLDTFMPPADAGGGSTTDDGRGHIPPPLSVPGRDVLGFAANHPAYTGSLAPAAAARGGGGGGMVSRSGSGSAISGAGRRRCNAPSPAGVSPATDASGSGIAGLTDGEGSRVGENSRAAAAEPVAAAASDVGKPTGIYGDGSDQGVEARTALPAAAGASPSVGSVRSSDAGAAAVEAAVAAAMALESGDRSLSGSGAFALASPGGRGGGESPGGGLMNAARGRVVVSGSYTEAAAAAVAASTAAAAAAGRGGGSHGGGKTEYGTPPSMSVRKKAA